MPAWTDYDVERAYWIYADALHKYSETFGGDRQASAYWADQAATAYKLYLEWFLGLDSRALDTTPEPLQRSMSIRSTRSTSGKSCRVPFTSM